MKLCFREKNQRQSKRDTEIAPQQSSNEVIDRTLNNKQLINQLLIQQRVYVFLRIADSHTYRNRKINRI